MYKVRDSLVENVHAKEKSDRIFLIIVAFITVVMAVIFTLNQFVYMGVQVKGASMYPTLNDKDVLIVNKIKSVQNGSVIVISGEQKDWIIKRVVATAGSVVEFGDDGYVYIDGEKYSDEYGFANFSDRQTVPFEKKTLAEGEFFYLGDNRFNSRDGRDYGTCEKSQIVGVVEQWSIKNKILNKIFFWV